MLGEGASRGKGGEKTNSGPLSEPFPKLQNPFQSEWRPSLWSKTTSKFSGFSSAKLRDSSGPHWVGSGRLKGLLPFPTSVEGWDPGFQGSLQTSCLLACHIDSHSFKASFWSLQNRGAQATQYFLSLSSRVESCSLYMLDYPGAALGDEQTWLQEVFPPTHMHFHWERASSCAVHVCHFLTLL